METFRLTWSLLEKDVFFDITKIFFIRDRKKDVV